jgi:hypothetical protein
MNQNPYSPPESFVADVALGSSQADVTRREHIRHEVQLKSVGSLYFLVGALMSLGGISMAVMLSGDASSTRGPVPVLIFGGVYLAFGVAALFLGLGFRRLRPWVRIPGGILSTLGLLGFPVGTLINAWILYLMFGAKGKVVLGPDYQAVIDATPHVKYVRTVGDWIALVVVVLMLLGVVGLIAAALIGR